MGVYFASSELFRLPKSIFHRDLRGMAQIIVAKHRKGATGDVLLRFRGEFTRFQNPDEADLVPFESEGGNTFSDSKMNIENMPIGEISNVDSF